jgi:hypothetical protein
MPRWPTKVPKCEVERNADSTETLMSLLDGSDGGMGTLVLVAVVAAFVAAVLKG